MNLAPDRLGICWLHHGEKQKRNGGRTHVSLLDIQPKNPKAGILKVGNRAGSGIFQVRRLRGRKAADPVLKRCRSAPIRDVKILLLALLSYLGVVAGTVSPASGAEREFASIIGVCEATTLDEAAIRGGRLGWPVAPEDENWRRGFEKHNGGTVRVLGWRRTSREGDGLLSYWTASGPNAHTACVFSTDHPGLLAALRGKFGAPETLDEHGDIVSASWSLGGRQMSFTRVGKSSSFNLSSNK